MTTSSNIASGRPSLPTRHSHHGCGLSTNQMLSFSYEGYLFVPSEHHSRADRWMSAQPIKISVSQGDLFKEVVKRQRSGKTALEEFCGPRVDDAKRGMINKLIKERTTSESGSTYTLAAISIDGDYISDEESDSGKISLRDHESKNKETTSVLIVLQGSVGHCRDGVPVNFLQNRNPNSAGKTIGSVIPPAEKLMSWTAPCTPTSGTPLRYIPSSYKNVDSNVNGSDQSLTPQQVYQRSDDTQTLRSESPSSSTSFDTSRSSSPFTPTSATSNNDCFIAVDHARNHNYPPVPTPPSAYAWSGISMPTESTKEEVLNENAHEQQRLRVQHQPTQATDSARPYIVISSSTQTDISITDPCEDGRDETLDVLTWSTGETGRPSTADHGPESESIFSLRTSEDHTMSTGDLMEGGDSPLLSQVPRARSPDILERKPSWMDNMVPVITPPADVNPVETILEETNAESSVTEDYNPKPSNEKDTEHQNANKGYQYEHQETSYGHSGCDEFLTTLPRPAKEDIQASVYNAETKGRKTLRPQYTKTTEYIDSLSNTSEKGTANEARYLPPSLGRPRSYEKLRPIDHTLGKSHQPIALQKRYDDVKYGATDPEKSHVSTSHLVSSLGKPRSYERLRPHTPSASQPAGIRKIYRIKTYNDPDKASNKHVKFSKPLASSSSLDAPTGSNISCPDTPPSSTQTTIASDPTEPPRTTSQATSRPLLYRQSNYTPVHRSDIMGVHHSSSKTNNSKPSSKPTSREVGFSGRKHEKENDSYNSCKADDNSDREQRTTKYVWSCPYRHCNRHRGRPFATREEEKEHLRIAHKRDQTGREWSRRDH